ncbi:hypothetical protein L9F63_021878, partial [Diploptera punctata]
LNSIHGQVNNSVSHPFWRSKRQGCSSTEFQCTSGQCIDETTVCDGVKDCTDGSDEVSSLCSKTACPSYTFKCDYGACIDRTKTCDGASNCADGSDEQLPSCVKRPNNGNCKDDEYRCESEKCIDGTLQCDGLKDCDDGSDETYSHCNNIRCPPFAFRCSYGACIDRNGRCDGRPQCADSSDEDPTLCGTAVPGTDNPCFNGAWSNPHPTCEPLLCPHLNSVSVDFKCSLNNNKVDCDEPMAPGTEAQLACKQAYRLVNEPGYTRLICQPNGMWDKPVFTCIQECGKEVGDGQPFITGGTQAEVGQFPWHVGIYRDDQNGFTQICGGTLVNPDTVISAAHCFWNDNYNRALDKSKFQVAAGKYYRDWNVEDTDIQRQKITGWGVGDDNEASKVLLTTQLPFVDFDKCWDEVSVTFRDFITKDKFCAGYTNGTSVCPGDSGGGLTFRYNERYYLRGIVSVGRRPEGSKKCYSDQYTVFTKVSVFLTWIQQYVR